MLFPPETRARIVALACTTPESCGIPIGRWSSYELSLYMLRRWGVRIHRSTVARWLKADVIKPWRIRSWQHCTDPDFLPRAKAVLELYSTGKSLLQQGIWVVCADEKTSIQARQGLRPPRPAAQGRPVRHESRYKRKGAVNLFGALSVADGKVIGRCADRKRFADFKRFVINCVVPEGMSRKVREIRLILDNGPTHAPKQLERWLAAIEARLNLPFTFEVYWLPKYASWLDQIEIWFGILTLKVLRPAHACSKIDLRRKIRLFIEHYDREAKPICWTYTVEKLEANFGQQ